MGLRKFFGNHDVQAANHRRCARIDGVFVGCAFPSVISTSVSTFMTSGVAITEVHYHAPLILTMEQN